MFKGIIENMYFKPPINTVPQNEQNDEHCIIFILSFLFSSFFVYVPIKRKTTHTHTYNSYNNNNRKPNKINNERVHNICGLSFVHVTKEFNSFLVYINSIFILLNRQWIQKSRHTYFCAHHESSKLMHFTCFDFSYPLSLFLPFRFFFHYNEPNGEN